MITVRLSLLWFKQEGLQIQEGFHLQQQNFSCERDTDSCLKVNREDNIRQNYQTISNSSSFSNNCFSFSSSQIKISNIFALSPWPFFPSTPPPLATAPQNLVMKPRCGVDSFWKEMLLTEKCTLTSSVSAESKVGCDSVAISSEHSVNDSRKHMFFINFSFQNKDWQ